MGTMRAPLLDNGQLEGTVWGGGQGAGQCGHTDASHALKVVPAPVGAVQSQSCSDTTPLRRYRADELSAAYCAGRMHGMLCTFKVQNAKSCNRHPEQCHVKQTKKKKKTAWPLVFRPHCTVSFATRTIRTRGGSTRRPACPRVRGRMQARRPPVTSHGRKIASLREFRSPLLSPESVRRGAG